MKRFHLRLLVLCLIAMAALSLVGIVLAISGPAIGWQVIAGDGAPSSGGNVTINDTLGQPIIGPSSGGNIALGAGYWYGLGYDETKCDLVEGNTYAYNQTWPVSITLQTKGTLDCLRVRRYDQDHANRTGASASGHGVGWGRYWTITATDILSATASGFTLTLTLPHNGLTAPRLCKYPGNLGGSGWDCDDGSHTTFTAGAVTRSGITSLSDWAVGDAVGATAVEVKTFSAEAGDSGGLWLLVLFAALIGAALLRFTLRRADC
jgi:hypothetical protein